MSTYTATIRWTRKRDGDFTKGQYSRAHEWAFDGGITGFVVDEYVDEADGLLEKRADGKIAMARVTLRPHVTWGGEAPDAAAIADLHHRAHEACFTANSVNTEVTVQS